MKESVFYLNHVPGSYHNDKYKVHTIDMLGSGLFKGQDFLVMSGKHTLNGEIG